MPDPTQQKLSVIRAITNYRSNYYQRVLVPDNSVATACILVLNAQIRQTGDQPRMSTAQIGPQLPIVTMPAYRRRTASTKLNWRRDQLEKVEYQPDNSRIGRESAGIQSKVERANKAETVIALMRNKYSLNLACGIVQKTAVATVALPVEYDRTVSKPIGCERKPGVLGNQTVGERVQFRTEYVQNPKPTKYQPANNSTEKGKGTWTAKYGQRPIVQRSK